MFKGKLFVPFSGTTIDKTKDGVDWELATSLVLDGSSALWRSPDGTNWERVMTGGFGDKHNVWLTRIYPMGSELYAVGRQFSSGNGVELWKSSDGRNWSQVNEDGFGNPDRYAIEP